MQQIADWLKRLGVEQYAHCFDEHDIDFSILRDLTDQDLEKIGVQSLGHRRKLLRAIADLNDIKKSAPAAAIAAAAAPAAPRPLDFAERRQVTVMFSDLVGSTALSARMDPEDLREVISAYQNRVAETVRRFDGFVAKYMGDGVLIYFGYPQAHEDDAECAVRAALSLIETVPKLETAHDAVLQVRVGIATGLVVVGDLIGEGVAQEHGVVGDAPNLAARLQALAEPGLVVISDSTRRLTGGMFEYRDLGEVALKGLSDPVQAWQVTGASAVQSRFEAQHESNLTPLVGREEELELLLRRWRQAASGEGRVVLLSGEPGIGKSRLTVALQERLQKEPHTRLRYFCSPHHQDSALYPTISQLERAAGFQRNDAPDAKLEKLTTLLGASSGESETQLIAELLSIPTGDRYAPLNVSPQRQKEKTFEALLAQLGALSRRRPVLMLHDDVHWIDPSSRELLDMTVERIPSLPVLLIITFRPEFQPPWIGQAHVSMLSLSRFGRREGAALVQRVAGNKALSDEIMAEIVERTDGIPLFVEELTKAVLEAGPLDEVATRSISTAPLPALAVPATLHASLMARLDRLGPAAKEIAQTGAAIGREFSYELLAAVVQTSDADLQAALARLGDAGLVFCRGTPPQTTFLFKHALVRDAAYGTLLRGQRQQIHARVSATLESQFPEIVASQPQLVAQHCAEAGLNEKAVGYHLKAGQQALARSAMTEAVGQLQRGLDVLASLPENPWRAQQELDLQIALGRALMATMGYAAPAVGETIVRARALAEQLDRPDDLVSLLFSQWTFHLVRAEHKLALSFAEQTEKVGAAQNDEAMLLLGHFSHGNTRFFLGEFVAARALFERCHGLRDPAHRAAYAALTAEDPYALNVGRLAVTLAVLGYIDQARARMDEAQSEARRLDHVFTVVRVLTLVCQVDAVAGSPHGLQRHAEELTALASEHGFQYWVGWGLPWQGWSLTGRGRAQDGLTLLAKGHSLIRATGAVLNTPLALCFLAKASANLGQLEEGLNCLVEGAQIHRDD